MVEAKVCIGFAITKCDKTKTWSAVRPLNAQMTLDLL